MMFYMPELYLIPTSHRPSYDSVNSYGSGGGAYDVLSGYDAT